MTPEINWQARFEQQAGWTAQVRAYLYDLVKIHQAGRVLETGCGTGAILRDLPAVTSARVFGIDIRRDFLRIAQSSQPSLRLAAANVYSLPFAPGSFDVCLCHFFLLWVDPAQALAEMRRVTRSGGKILALAEPDYGGRIDYPPELESLGQHQAAALQEQGADPRAGRKLAALFHQAGLVDVFTGVVGGFWASVPSQEDIDLEWQVLRHDLAGRLNPTDLELAEHQDRQAWASATRILYIPTFYAAGAVP